MVWLVIITDQAVVLYWFGLPVKVAVIDSLISKSFLLLASLAIINTLRFYMPRKENYIHLLSWVLFFTVLIALLEGWVLNAVFGEKEGYSQFLHHSLAVRVSLDFLLLSCLILFTVLWFHQKEQQLQEQRKDDAERMAKEAELFKLRQQLQPHFLFNSLNSINALIGSRPDEARKMVQQLSDFLRGTIKKEETQWVTLQEEMQYLQLYLEIEKVRFGNRLSTKVEIDENAAEMKLPSLLLQPIVENAIKFGLYDTIGDTEIKIYAAKDKNNLVLKVINPYDPETATPQMGTGFGLKSVQRRLYLLFARNDLLQTLGKENTFTTIVVIPQTTPTETLT
ncbi:MAG TPA: histidine kinase [Niabella sp.]|nr:histidine kinase [Niabella sp.]HUM98765.1 histidine kinase [Chitinophagaceae bacterium]